MTEKDNKILNSETGRSSAEEMALMIEGLYNGVVASLKKLKAEICNELKYSSLQINGFCEMAQKEATQMVAQNQATIMAVSKELKYGYQQNQMIHEDLVHLIGDDLMSKLETVEGKLETLGEIDKIVSKIEETAADLSEKIENLKFDDEPMIEKIREIVVSTYEPIDYAKVNDMLETSLAKTENVIVEQTQDVVERALESSLIKTENVIVEQTQEIVEKASVAVAEQSQQILNAINAIEMPESVDYTRIVEEVSERVLELLREELIVCEEEVIEEDEIVDGETEETVEETTETTEEVAEDEATAEEVVEEVAEETAEEVAEEATEEVVEEATTEETVEEVAEEEMTEGETIAEEVVEDEVTETVEEVVEEEAEEVVEEKPVVTEIDYDRIVERTAEKVVESLPFSEKIDYKLIEEMVQSVTLDVVVLAEEISDKVLEKLPQPEVPETIDYDRIAEVVTENVPAPEMIDYERLAETVISKMPAPETVDYDVLAETVLAKMPVPEAVDYDRLAETVLAKMPAPEAIDYDRLADTVLAKMPVPETIDYEALSDMIVSKMPKPADPVAVDYETLAEMVTAKMVAYEESKEEPVYDVVMDAEGVEKVANGVCENLNLDIIAEKVSEKLVVAEPEKLDYELLADMVAERLAVKIELVSEPIEEYEETVEETAEEVAVTEETTEEFVEEVAEETTEEVVEEVAEETTEEVVEEVAEETTEEVVEETTEEVVEEPVVEDVAEEELAVAQANEYTEDGNELVDAETGMVVRLKRSFTAKLKQSDEDVKVYYDAIKNELVSYKKVKSTVSWHGDRFNLGRSTVAKINICGKTLCFFIALDPEDPELKTTVYHQKNVGDQKAYQATPFKIKVKSEMGAKRAIRLVGILAEKIGATKKNDFVPTDYVEEFAYETTKELLEKGLIKETKEKKIAFEF